MSVQPRTHETVSEAQTTDPRANYISVGIDNEGAHHVYRTTDESVHVIENGERTVRYDLEDVEKTIDDWIDYIADRRGGFEVQYLFKTMADAIVGAVEVSDR
ncbi:hypothetical protein BDK88_4233 [Natrinema hispanicum]|uniref:Uncharacterized protein n=1 Tax=Natrinema hispanicum TaxID=392421 RepID=A0A482Y0L6_9EURY|nr:hypothetical protein [Natrinema hispanicum]RZV05210.1 hypothetical protein BDK88_4233 [Natrinema hispanicum]